MMELFCEADGIFPSVYQFYNSEGRPKVERTNQEYVFTNVQEAVRIASEVPVHCRQRALSTPPPVWAYAWLRYHASGSPLMSDQDVQMYWQQSYAAGASGLVLWGYEPTRQAAAEFAAYWKRSFTSLINKWQPPRQRLGARRV